MIGQGRPPKDIEIEEVRSLSRDELVLIKQVGDKPRSTPIIERLRDPHHNLARFIAMGMRDGQAAQRAGYSINRVSILRNSPAFVELIAYYRNLVTESYREEVDEYMELVTSNMVKAERQIAEKLEEADENGETLPTRELVAISRDAADRTGYGKKSTTVNVNVDFAAQLEARRARAMKTIESTATPPVAGGAQPATTPQATQAGPTIEVRRRA